MKLSISGIYENGEIKLSAKPPTLNRQTVIVTFDTAEQEQAPKSKKRILGQLEGQNRSIPSDFNNPLTDLKDYM